MSFGDVIGLENFAYRWDRMTDMQASHWTLKARGLALACAVLAAAFASPAVGAEEEDNLPDAVLFRNILQGLGLRAPPSAGIEYRERSPLVVPPTMALPPPDTRPLAERNPAWPVDQDVRRAREAAVARRAQRFDNVREIREQGSLSREELTPGRRTRPPAGSVSGPYGTPEHGSPVEPSALGYVGGLFGSMFGGSEEKPKPFTGEPPRTALIDPPPGYQTPSPNQPYRAGKRTNEVKILDMLDLQPK